MNKIVKMIGTATIALSLAVTGVSAANTGSAVVEDAAAYGIEEMLLYAYQDEANALKEYEELMAVFGEEAPFVNIAKAEESHMAAVLRLYDYYDLEVPDYQAEEFIVPETVEEAYAIGVEAEIKNIAMYETFLSTDLDPVMERVFESLKQASESHLQAFENAVDGVICDQTTMQQNGKDNGNRGQGNSSRGNANSRGNSISKGNGNRGK